MTSEVQQRREEAPPLPSEETSCLCCCHFAVDLESIPEALDKRRARLPKRKHLSPAESF